jgi:hypothetical protein
MWPPLDCRGGALSKYRRAATGGAFTSAQFKFSLVFCYGRLVTNFNMPRPARLVLAKSNALLTIKWAPGVESRPPV